MTTKRAYPAGQPGAPDPRAGKVPSRRDHRDGEQPGRVAAHAVGAAPETAPQVAPARDHGPSTRTYPLAAPPLAAPPLATPPGSADYRPTRDATPIEGQLLDRSHGAAGEQRPDSVIQLIYLMWLSLDWRRAGTTALLTCAVGLVLCAVLGDLGYLLIGLSPLLSAGGGFLVGGGVAAAGYRYLRRGRGRSAAPPA